MRAALKICLPGFLSMIIISNVMTQPVFAQKAAQAINVKIGYFNLNLVKMSDPGTGNPDLLKNQAEEQLKRDVVEGNARVQKLKNEKKSEEDIKKLVSQLQIEINAKQQALAQLVQSSSAMAQDKIRQAVAAVAKERSLDIVLDGAGVYDGGQKIVESGVDVTEDIVKKLNPNGPSKTISK